MPTLCLFFEANRTGKGYRRRSLDSQLHPSEIKVKDAIKMIAQSQGASVCFPAIQHGFICTDCFNLLNRIIPLYSLVTEFVEWASRAGYDRPTVAVSGSSTGQSQTPVPKIKRLREETPSKTPRTVKKSRVETTSQSIGIGTSPCLWKTPKKTHKQVKKAKSENHRDMFVIQS